MSGLHDLRLAMALMAFLSVLVFFITRRVVCRLHPRLLDALAVGVVLCVGLYVRLVWGQLWIVNWIPLPSVIVLSNWFPILLAMLAGIFWERMRTQSFLRRLPAQVILIAGTVWSEIYVIPRNPPKCGDLWIEPTELVPVRICQQTTPDTCSAAAAATILTAIGIPATEAEMAKLCLTGDGTTWLGLYHGMAIRLRGSRFNVEFFECSVEELPRMIDQFPALLCCRLDRETDERFPVYSEERGWLRGLSHSTVLLKSAPPQFLIGDPSQKEPEVWTQQDVEHLWTGTGLRIVERGPAH